MRNQNIYKFSKEFSRSILSHCRHQRYLIVNLSIWIHSIAKLADYWLVTRCTSYARLCSIEKQRKKRRSKLTMAPTWLPSSVPPTMRNPKPVSCLMSVTTDSPYSRLGLGCMRPGYLQHISIVTTTRAFQSTRWEK